MELCLYNVQQISVNHMSLFSLFLYACESVFTNSIAIFNIAQGYMKLSEGGSG